MPENGAKNEHEHLIHYKLDDEPESTIAKFLTPTQILTDGGFDPKTNYLEQLIGHGEIKGAGADLREIPVDRQSHQVRVRLGEKRGEIGGRVAIQVSGDDRAVAESDQRRGRRWCGRRLASEQDSAGKQAEKARAKPPRVRCRSGRFYLSVNTRPGRIR